MSARQRDRAEAPAAKPSAPGGRGAAGGAVAGTGAAASDAAGTGTAAGRRSGLGDSAPFEIDSWEPSLLHKLLGIDNTLTKN